MSWTVKVRSKNFEFHIDGRICQSEISLKSESFSKEKSQGYQEPDDDVLDSVFLSTTDHGDFEWHVRSIRTGFNTRAEIEVDSLVAQPENVDDFEPPEFFVVNS